MLAKIGVKVNLVAQPKGPHFTLIQKNPPETEFYLLGWGVPTYDSHYIFSFLYHTRSGSEGSWNATRYSNAEIDKAIQSLTSEVDTGKRDATIAKIWKVLADETNYIALHHQMLAYAHETRPRHSRITGQHGAHQVRRGQVGWPWPNRCSPSAI